MKFPTMDEFAQMVAEKALDEYEYNGKTIRQWIEIIYNAEHSTGCISRQQAIDAFNTNIDELVVAGKENADAVERYLNRVIDEIKQLPPIQPDNCSENPNNSDVVGRQAAKNAICNACGKIDCDEMDTCKKLDIPSEGSKALKWQYHSCIPHNKYCPKCKKDSPYNKRWNFCPNCGAKMDEVTT